MPVPVPSEVLKIGDNQDNIIRTGPIVREIKKTRNEIRKEQNFDKKTIVLSVGGTDAGIFLIKQTISAIEKIQLDVDLVLVTGPEIKLKFNDSLRNLGFISNLHEIIFAADLVISLAGKSTIDESIIYGTPGIFIPIKDHFEQEDNAKEMGFSFKDIFNLEVLIKKALERDRTEQQENGVGLAGMEIKKILLEKK